MGGLTPAARLPHRPAVTKALLAGLQRRTRPPRDPDNLFRINNTVRRLKPGTFDVFLRAFRPKGDDLPKGWVRDQGPVRTLEEDEITAGA